MRQLISGLLAFGLIFGMKLLVQASGPFNSFGSPCIEGSPRFCGRALAVGGGFTPSGQIVSIGETDRVITGLAISSTRGPCVLISGGTDVSVQGNQIGPCGTDLTTLSSQGVFVNGGNNISVYDNYIHVETMASGCCDTHDGVEYNGVNGGTIQGNVICYGESNIELQGNPSRNIVIEGNYLCNPRGPYPRGQNVQTWPKRGISSNLTVSNNYMFSCFTKSGVGILCPGNPVYSFAETQEDSINIGHTSGAVVRGNYVVGGHSPSGCGILVDEAANGVQVARNILSNTGQCGIGIASGADQKVTDNNILNTTPVPGAGNTAFYIWNQYPSSPCGPVEASNNIADEKRPDGNSGFWNGGGCGTVNGIGNLYGSSPDRALPAPPAIPPRPKNCVAASPYSTNSSLPRC